MRRLLIGILGISLLLLGAALSLWPTDIGRTESLRAAAFRLGPFLVVLWLAFPQLEKLPEWFFLTLPILIYLLAFRPRWFLIALPLVLAVAFLMPRPRGTTARSSRRSAVNGPRQPS